jgi:hypothetical protein
VLASGSLLSAVVKALWVFLILGAAWVWIAPLYDSLLAGASNWFLPDGLTLSASGLFMRLEYVGEPRNARLQFESFALHTGLLVLLALVLTTPSRKMVWRLAAAAAALAGVFILHLMGMTGFSRSLLSTLQSGGGSADALLGFAVFWGVTPAAFGLLWVYRAWLPALRPGRALAPKESSQANSGPSEPSST